MKNLIKSITPEWILSIYHFSLAALAALLYQLPSRSITIVAVTGTKGKSSTLEYLNAIAEAAGMRTALSSTIRFKIADHSEPNLKRQTQPGRFFLQKFFSQAVRAKCDIAFVEMTSEGARQHRHRFINLDALIFTNLAPEHIESHGSYEAYADAKFQLGRQLVRSRKRPRFMVANADDVQGGRYLTLAVEHALPISLEMAKPWETSDHGGTFRFEDTEINVRQPGMFSIQNALAAATLMRALGVSVSDIKKGIESLLKILGRTEEIGGAQCTVVVDYAHTPDSLRALYNAYRGHKRICVLGSTGGGRDTWKRPVMGEIADTLCDVIILTNEDPYDEDPQSIIDGIARGITQKTPEIIMDRREAIARALALAHTNDVVLISGKGTDPTIQGPRGTSIPWSDAEVAREEIQKLTK
jgi:UDP-N-acetylmuramoyl-L-alanyl-D-glutamate--2,6-diaminopimelate ligase